MNGFLGMLGRIGFGLGLACLLIAGAKRAQAAGAIDEAGKLFAIGRPAEAASALERTLRTNALSADLWFNLGQARLQAGEPGRAMAAFRRGHQLSPRDGGIRAAMEQLRQKVGTSGPHPLAMLTGWLRDEEWAVLALLATAGFGGVLARRLIRPESAGSRWLVVAAVQIFLVAGWGAAWLGRGLSANAVVVQRDLSVVQAPVPEARSIGTLAEGVEVRVLRSHGAWAEVEVDGRRVGWIPRSAMTPD